MLQNQKYTNMSSSKSTAGAEKNNSSSMKNLYQVISIVGTLFLSFEDLNTVCLREKEGLTERRYKGREFLRDQGGLQEESYFMCRLENLKTQLPTHIPFQSQIHRERF